MIYIPTLGRVHKQITWNYLRDTRYAEQVRLVTVAEQADELARYTGAEVIICPPEADNNLAAKRQWIMEYDRGTHIQLDDDLRFSSRQLDKPSSFLTVQKSEETELLFDRVFTMLEQVPLASVINRQGANRQPAPATGPGRMHAFLAVNGALALEHGWRWDRVINMEDFDFHMQVLFSGYPTALLSTHAKDDGGGPNAPGGCSIYRDIEGHENAVQLMCRYWPEVCTPRYGKPWAGDMNVPRLDIRAQWSLARKLGTEGRDMVGLPPIPDPDWSDLAPEWTLV